MPSSIKIFFLGLVLFVPLAVSTIWKRGLILLIGIAIGFAGPLLAVESLPALKSDDGWFWDVFALDAYNNKSYKDVILAIIPAAFICFTDFMNHVLDDEFSYKSSRLLYMGIFTLLSVLIFGVVFLPLSFDAVAHEKATWLGKFGYSWQIAKAIVVSSFCFEIALGVIEALREAREQFEKRKTQSSKSAGN